MALIWTANLEYRHFNVSLFPENSILYELPLHHRRQNLPDSTKSQKITEKSLIPVTLWAMGHGSSFPPRIFTWHEIIRTEE
ncbi:uncharacterized protein EAF01_000770 [Botrytis porri]|uniref:uncharacterized protein n=1 Tax=Botrytis porri TaxID=87229 RepID=UPI001902A8D5|nr:uncharacterized protein EAF01_000770 [Botrytis porri]KAF7914364.1 hypothetical protein EAF01_000770 [Botrytis porri]